MERKPKGVLILSPSCTGKSARAVRAGAIDGDDFLTRLTGVLPDRSWLFVGTGSTGRDLETRYRAAIMNAFKYLAQHGGVVLGDFPVGMVRDVGAAFPSVRVIGWIPLLRDHVRRAYARTKGQVGKAPMTREDVTAARSRFLRDASEFQLPVFTRLRDALPTTPPSGTAPIAAPRPTKVRPSKTSQKPTK